MKRLHFMGVALALTLPLASLVVKAQEPEATTLETIVTEANNGGAVTLEPGAVLVVHLKENPSTGYSRAMVSFPNMPIRLLSYRVLAKAPGNDGAPLAGAPRVSEWKFVAAGNPAVGQTTWLKFLQLRPFAPGVDATGLWEIKVSVPQTPAE